MVTLTQTNHISRKVALIIVIVIIDLRRIFNRVCPLLLVGSALTVTTASPPARSRSHDFDL